MLHRENSSYVDLQVENCVDFTSVEADGTLEFKKKTTVAYNQEA
jgi:hypothetical protein